MAVNLPGLERHVNYFRNRISRSVVASVVGAATLLSVILPYAGEAALSERIFVHLFGRSLDVPVDDAFLDSWDRVHASQAESIAEFVDTFLKAFGSDVDVPANFSDEHKHRLWTILLGISINLDPPAIPALHASASSRSPQIASSSADVAKRASLTMLPRALVAASASVQDIAFHHFLNTVLPRGP